MSRTLSSTALSAFYAQETGDFPIILITITEPSLTTPVRISSDPTTRLIENLEQVIYGTTSRGNPFYFIPFSIVLPSDTDDAAPKATISIDNVSRELTPIIRGLSTPPSVMIELVMSSTPNVVEAVFPDFSITTIDYDQLTISGDLTVDLLVAEPFPAGTFTPSRFPALF